MHFILHASPISLIAPTHSYAHVNSDIMFEMYIRCALLSKLTFTCAMYCVCDCAIVTGYFDKDAIHVVLEESVKMKEFDHPNVLTLFGVCVDAGPTPYIVMPFMAKGSLLSYLRKERHRLLLSEEDDDEDVSD